MTISIYARIRNALVGLALALCVCFVCLIFMVAFIVEDRVFINQLQAEQAELATHLDSAEGIGGWQPKNANIILIKSAYDLPNGLSPVALETISNVPGIHEYFDRNSAGFISHFKHSSLTESAYLIYEVGDVLAVRDSKKSMLVLLSIVSVFVAIFAVLLAHKLAKKTLAPVHALTKSLDLSSDVSEFKKLADGFSHDEIGILANELTKALTQAQQASQRELEFNQGVSHELRSPIQVASSATELLELQSTGSLNKPAFARLKRAVDQMAQITDAFLWLSSDKRIANEACSLREIKEICAVSSEGLAVRTTLDDNYSYSLPNSVVHVLLRSLFNNAASHGDGQPPQVECDKRSIQISNSYDAERAQKESAGDDNAGFGLGLVLAERLCQRFAWQLIITRDTDPKLYCVKLVQP